MAGHFPPRLTPQRQRSSSSVPPYPSSTNSDTSIKDGKTGLDITQRLEQKLAAYNASGNVFKRWYFEILTWLVSALCSCTIVTIYAIIKNRSLAELGSILTLTNILGKVSTVALIVPTTEALGQLKWNWFHTSNAIWDCEIFDKATRGLWGAVTLLYRNNDAS